MRTLKNIWALMLKEFRSLFTDPVLLVLITFMFTGSIINTAKGISTDVKNATVGIIDQDRSQLSMRIRDAIQAPFFKLPQDVRREEVDALMDKGEYIFILEIPPNFERDVQAGRSPNMQLLVDATVMSQAGVGASYLSQIINREVNSFAGISMPVIITPVVNTQFNPNGESAWYMPVSQVGSNAAMIMLILVGAAVIRERERGMQTLLFSSIPMLFVSGFPWPTESLPELVQALRWIIPSTAGIQGAIAINQLGAGFAEVRGELFALALHARDIALNHGQPGRGHADVLATDPNVARAAPRCDIEHIAHAQRCHEQAFIGKCQAALVERVAALQQLRLIGGDHQADAAAADVEQGQANLQRRVVRAPDRRGEFDRVGYWRCQTEILAPLQAQERVGDAPEERATAIVLGGLERTQAELDLHLVDHGRQDELPCLERALVHLRVAAQIKDEPLIVGVEREHRSEQERLSLVEINRDQRPLLYQRAQDGKNIRPRMQQVLAVIVGLLKLELRWGLVRNGRDCRFFSFLHCCS